MQSIHHGYRTLQIFTKMWRYFKLSDHEEADYKKLKKRFTQELIRHLHLRIHRENAAVPLPGAAIYVCNHISYLDIPLMMNILPEAHFVSKKEVAHWPLIGRVARRIDTVFVQRENKHSRALVKESLSYALHTQGKKIIVFPSGTTKIVKSERWRKGVFELAHQHNIPIVPLRIDYKPLRVAAYIDDDNFIAHLFALVRKGNIEVNIEFSSPVEIKNPLEDCERIKAWCEEKMA